MLCDLSSDIDECIEGTDNCDDNAACTNTDGSFTCLCALGYSGTGTTCAGELLAVVFSVHPMHSYLFSAVQLHAYVYG